MKKNKNSIPNKYSEFKKRNAPKVLAVAIVLFLVFCISLFKNISYPLLWADETETAIGTERVLKFGYPKVHDGKNVFYTYRYSSQDLAINKKDDAFIGGDNWGHYYFGILGYKLAENFTDIYWKTGIYRATYAFMGLLGILIFCFCSSKFISDKFTKYSFICLFLFFEISSIALTLHLREVRYYSPTLLLSSIIISSYTIYRFHKKYNYFAFLGILATALCLLFNTFIPVGVILIASIGLSEFILALFKYVETKEVKISIMPSIRIAIPIIIGVALASPLIIYCRTFQISKAVDKFFGFSSALYFQHFSMAVTYLFRSESLLTVLILKIGILLNFKKIVVKNNPLFKLSCFLTLVFIVFIFLIPKVPMTPLFTRYYIYLQPILSLIVLSDLFILLNYYYLKSKTAINFKTAALIAIFSISTFYILSKKSDEIKGHIYELTHQYKGPLDYTIPYIMSHYSRPDTLIIATNYEETSYMYYLKSKVIMGFVGNNVKEDSLLKPDIISFRKYWGSPYFNVYNNFLKKVPYKVIKFPIADVLVNNIPELNVDCHLTHLFKTPLTDDEQNQTQLFVR